MLCEGDAGNQEEVVVKRCNRVETRETGLICELLASLLARDLDLPVSEPEWKAKSGAATKIVEYLKQAQRNRDQIISNLNRLLQ